MINLNGGESILDGFDLVLESGSDVVVLGPLPLDSGLELGDLNIFVFDDIPQFLQFLDVHLDLVVVATLHGVELSHLLRLRDVLRIRYGTILVGLHESHTGLGLRELLAHFLDFHLVVDLDLHQLRHLSFIFLLPQFSL